jgi:hypothetical protein
MKYTIPAIIAFILLPLTVLAVIIYMRKRGLAAKKLTPAGAGAQPPAQGNAPVFNNIAASAGALGKTAVQGTADVATSLQNIRSILAQFTPDNADYTPDPTLPANTPFYQWGTGDPMAADPTIAFDGIPN